MGTKHSKAAGKYLKDTARSRWHDNTLWGVRVKRDNMAKELPEWEQLRNMASAIKKHTVTHLADYLEQFEKNALKWAQCQKEGVPCPVKISKDARARRHACLVPWEELNALSKRENELTGRNTDYQQMDINNVLALPKLLREQEKQEKKNPALQ